MAEPSSYTTAGPRAIMSFVTKVDENAIVPLVDQAARERLAAVLDRPGVISALLFGSQATGKANRLSDVDIAVWLSPGLNGRDASEFQLELIAASAEALNTDEVQVVILGEATPLLQHRAMRDGVRLVDRDPRARVGLETAALLEYLDTAPLRAELAKGLRHRIEEGRFGRP